MLGTGAAYGGLELTGTGKKLADQWNLFTGTKLYGQVDPGGDVITPTTDQLTAAKLAASGFDQNHLDYLSTLGSPISSNSSLASIPAASSADASASQAPTINVSVYAYTDRTQLMQEWRRDPSTKKMIIDTLTNNRGMV